MLNKQGLKKETGDRRQETGGKLYKIRLNIRHCDDRKQSQECAEIAFLTECCANLPLRSSRNDLGILIIRI
ncbi:MAG: hypothetical protein F6K18_25005 [Okeania sp. SIO2C2]|uniref:hypothetical protein n=1 Tax=Okeania sp. SIO2C2 TaxID=2607787 RepID=UPI0013BC015C|nr:hypothetical protein [Okeania sp. SIO2C2]NEP89821.1 hypothetical protein [Okeania sp. SIO2C2]